MLSRASLRTSATAYPDWIAGVWEGSSTSPNGAVVCDGSSSGLSDVSIAGSVLRVAGQSWERGPVIGLSWASGPCGDDCDEGDDNVVSIMH